MQDPRDRLWAVHGERSRLSPTDCRHRELALPAAKVFGLRSPELVPVQNMVNASFRVHAADGDFHLRIARAARRSQSQLECESAFLDALAAAGMRVPVPRRNPLGGWVWTSPDGVFHVTVATWLSGAVLPNAERTAAHFRRLGAMLGRLHVFSREWPRPPGFRRPEHFAADMFPVTESLSPAIRGDLDRAKKMMREAEQHLTGPERRGLIHGDASFGNVLFDHDEPALIDFDDCGDGLFAFDLAVVLAGAWGKPDYDANVAALLSGYETHRALATAERAAMPALMAARAASLLFWASRQDPEHPWITGQHERMVAYLTSAI